MNTDWAPRLVSLVGQWSLLTCAILSTCWIATLLARKNASLRHLFWTLGLAAILIAPALTFLVPSRNVIKATKPLAAAPLTEPLDTSAIDVSSVEPSPVKAEFPWAIPALLWISGIALVGLQGGLASFAVHRLRKKSVVWRGDAVEPAALGHEMGVRRSWQLRQSSTEKPPAAMTWGFVRPVVLLPQDCSAWSLLRLRATITHELAHVRRADSLTQKLALIACALHWFNPAVWLAARALRAEAESAADDAVLRSGIKPSDYATELLSLAAELGHLSQPAFSQGVSIMKDSRIEARIRAIVDPSRRRRGVSSLQTMVATTIGLASVTVLAAICPTFAIASPDVNPTIEYGAYQQSADVREVNPDSVTEKKLRLAIEAQKDTLLAQKSADMVMEIKQAKFHTSADSKTVAEMRQQIAKLQADLARSNARLKATQKALEGAKHHPVEVEKARRMLIERQRADIEQEMARVNADRQLAEKNRAENEARVKVLHEVIHQEKTRDDSVSRDETARIEQMIAHREKAMDEAKMIQERLATDVRLVQEKRQDEAMRERDLALAEIQVRLAEKVARDQTQSKNQSLIEQKRLAEKLEQMQASHVLAIQQALTDRKIRREAELSRTIAVTKLKAAARAKQAAELARKKAADEAAKRKKG